LVYFASITAGKKLKGAIQVPVLGGGGTSLLKAV
jgi:hypothetical protein